MSTPHSKPLADQIREAIKASGKSNYRICKDTGIGEASLHRFTTGQRTVTLENAEKLMAYLGFRITPPRKTRRKRS